ncbi:hypothetical protein Tco_0954060 [Tanacetum coccineum]|uniref:Uncharacterized protein n=1 Tax=Tanacetum coccineum TaxID=301880 RepID=A0ABQ5E1Q3_9ASTR
MADPRWQQVTGKLLDMAIDVNGRVILKRRDLMDLPGDVVFRIHYNGIFMYDPLRYEQYRVVEMQACTIDRIMFSQLLDILVSNVKDNIWALFICIPGLDIDSGRLKLMESDADVHALYDLAEKHVKVDMFVAHLPQNLAVYYHKNLCLDGSDEELLSNNDLKGTRTESGFKRAFATLFGQDVETFTGTMFLNVDQLEKQLDNEEFQEIGSMAAFKVLETQF